LSGIIKWKIHSPILCRSPNQNEREIQSLLLGRICFVGVNYMAMKELKINDYKGREFIYNSDKRIDFSIGKPDKLYKYCSLDKFKIEQLKYNYFYLSHPNQLNDVLDGNPNLWDFSNIEIDDYAE